MTEDFPYTVTLKAGKGPDAPWIIIKADTAEQLNSRINDLYYRGVFHTVAHAGTTLVAAQAEEEMQRGK